MGVSSVYTCMRVNSRISSNLFLDAGCPVSRRRAARGGLVPPLRPGRPLPGLCAAQQGRRLRGLLPARRLRRRERLLQVSIAVPSLLSFLKANHTSLFDSDN